MSCARACRLAQFSGLATCGSGLLRREGWLINRKRGSMAFVHDTLTDGRPFRILTIVDNRSRHSPVLEAGGRRTGEMVGQVLDRVLGTQAGPRSSTVDHGTEFPSRALEDWAYRRVGRWTVFNRANP